MKKTLLFIFLIFIIILGFAIVASQNSLKQDITTTTTKATVTTKVHITNRNVKEEIYNYALDINYPQTGLKEIDENILFQVFTYVNNFKQAVRVPSPSSAKKTLNISYSTIYNDDNLLSFKFVNDQYMGEKDSSHIIWTKNFVISLQEEIAFKDMLTNFDVLKLLSQYAIEEYKDQNPDEELVLSGFEPKRENFLSFALADTSIIVYFDKSKTLAEDFEINVAFDKLVADLKANNK